MTKQTNILTAIILVVAVLAPLAAHAENNTTEQIAILASLAFVDYNQSVDMFFKNSGYYELNPVLGPSPSRADLLVFGLTGIGLTYVLAETLPAGWKTLVIDSVIATERLNIEDNRTLYKGWAKEGPPLRGRSMNGIPIMISMRF